MLFAFFVTVNNFASVNYLKTMLTLHVDLQHLTKFSYFVFCRNFCILLLIVVNVCYHIMVN